MKTPDHHTSKLGSKDFVLQANKWPFSITCNPLLATITESLIDLSLIKDMKVAMKKVASGTTYLKAKVIRNLTNLYGVDCIASQKLYKILTRDCLSLDSSSISAATEATESAEHDKTKSSEGSDDDDLVFNSKDSPGRTPTHRA